MVLQPFTGNGIGEMQRVHVSRSKVGIELASLQNQALAHDIMESKRGKALFTRVPDVERNF